MLGMSGMGWDEEPDGSWEDLHMYMNQVHKIW